MEIKWIAIGMIGLAGAISAAGAFSEVAKEKTKQAQIQLEIVKLQTSSGNFSGGK